jgi:hypothetical protein
MDGHCTNLKFKIMNGGGKDGRISNKTEKTAASAATKAGAAG